MASWEISQILLYVGYISVTGVFLPFPNLVSCSYCNMHLSTTVDRKNSKLEVGPFFRKEANVCLDMVTVRERYNPLQYGKTAMGMDTLDKNGNLPHAIKAWGPS